MGEGSREKELQKEEAMKRSVNVWFYLGLLKARAIDLVSLV
jgi:hypothetical protein